MGRLAATGSTPCVFADLCPEIDTSSIPLAEVSPCATKRRCSACRTGISIDGGGLAILFGIAVVTPFFSTAGEHGRALLGPSPYTFRVIRRPGTKRTDRGERVAVERADGGLIDGAFQPSDGERRIGRQSCC